MTVWPPPAEVIHGLPGFPAGCKTHPGNGECSLPGSPPQTTILHSRHARCRRPLFSVITTFIFSLSLPWRWLWLWQRIYSLHYVQYVHYVHRSAFFTLYSHITVSGFDVSSPFELLLLLIPFVSTILILSTPLQLAISCDSHHRDLLS